MGRIGRLVASSFGMKGCRLNEDRVRDRLSAIWLLRNFCPNLHDQVPVAMQWRGRLRSASAHGKRWSQGNKRHYVGMGSGRCAICCDEDLAFPLLHNDHCNSAVGDGVSGPYIPGSRNFHQRNLGLELRNKKRIYIQYRNARYSPDT